MSEVHTAPVDYEAQAKGLIQKTLALESQLKASAEEWKAMREKLAETCFVSGLSIREKYVSRIDGTVKYLFELEDGNCIESVVMRYKHGLTVCISSQVGCRMGCGSMGCTKPVYAPTSSGGNA